MITHTVLFRFSADDTQATTEAAEAKRLLELMPPLIPEIRSLWVGVDGRQSGGSRDGAEYDLALVTTHDSWNELASYSAHPEHIRLTAYIRDRLTARAVVDSSD